MPNRVLGGEAQLRVIVGNTAPLKDMLQRWKAVGNTVFDLTSPRFEPQTSRSRNKCVTARPSSNGLKCH